MYRPTQSRGRPVRVAGLLLLAGLLLWGLPAAAQPIKVTSAVPDMADQGTLGLLVTIGGENFGQGSKVKFYVTGTTNPGGIAVKSVKYKNSKTLEATIDVAPDAQTQLKFDIEVTSGSRTGKGTELFKVNVKQTGGDTTPPGTVTDLRTVEIEFNWTRVNWTAPADDGYDPSSGPAASYEIRVRKGWSLETPNCGPYTASVWPIELSAIDATDPCHVNRWGDASANPGSTESAILHGLSPNSVFWAMVRSIDDASPSGNWSSMAADLTYQISFTTGPAPETVWTATVLDDCQPLYYPCAAPVPRFDYDPSGNPALLYTLEGEARLATWNDSGWQIETAGVAIDGSNGDYDIAFDPASGEPTISSRYFPGNKPTLRFYRRSGATVDPWTVETVATGNIRSNALAYSPSPSRIPTIAYLYVDKWNTPHVRLAERIQESWTSAEIAVAYAHPNADVRLAFDSDGNPGVSFLKDLNGTSTLGFAIRKNGTWTVEQVNIPPAPQWVVYPIHSLIYDPHRGDFSAVFILFDGSAQYPFDNLIHYCERSAGTWTCELIAQEADLYGASVAVDAVGTVYVVYDNWPAGTVYTLIRRPGETFWSLEYVDWNGQFIRGHIRIGPDGQPNLSYSGKHYSSGAGHPGPVCFARRTPTTP